VVAAEDFARFKQLDIIASVQPTHATSDMYWAEDRLGSERIKGAYAWQTFDKFGVRLALGSDFPVEKANPLLGFHAAVTRQDAKNWPEKGWYPDQTLSREQALYGFTLGAAYAAFQEDQIGSIEVGKKADFVVLSQDIMSIPAQQILSTKVIATYLNGKPIYQR
jgi:predicted amidohydrolase YtcJ